MKQYKKIFVTLFILLIIITSNSYAHPGRTDANGGHYDHSTGEYHYHNNGKSLNTTDNSNSIQESNNQSSKLFKLDDLSEEERNKYLLSIGIDPEKFDKAQKTSNENNDLEKSDSSTKDLIKITFNDNYIIFTKYELILTVSLIIIIIAFFVYFITHKKN